MQQTLWRRSEGAAAADVTEARSSTVWMQQKGRTQHCPPLPAAQHQQTSALRLYDVFLSHSGGTDNHVKVVLDWASDELNKLPSTDSSAPIRAFRDEDDLKGTGRVRSVILAALHQSPIGAHWHPDSCLHQCSGRRTAACVYFGPT